MWWAARKEKSTMMRGFMCVCMSVLSQVCLVLWWFSIQCCIVCRVCGGGWMAFLSLLKAGRIKSVFSLFAHRTISLIIRFSFLSFLKKKEIFFAKIVVLVSLSQKSLYLQVSLKPWLSFFFKIQLSPPTPLSTPIHTPSCVPLLYNLLGSCYWYW